MYISQYFYYNQKKVGNILLTSYEFPEENIYSI